MASSKGDTRDAYRGIHLEIALKVPIKERMAVHVLGGETEARAETLCVLGERVP